MHRSSSHRWPFVVAITATFGFVAYVALIVGLHLGDIPIPPPLNAIVVGVFALCWAMPGIIRWNERPATRDMDTTASIPRIEDPPPLRPRVLLPRHRFAPTIYRAETPKIVPAYIPLRQTNVEMPRQRRTRPTDVPPFDPDSPEFRAGRRFGWSERDAAPEEDAGDPPAWSPDNGT